MKSLAYLLLIVMLTGGVWVSAQEAPVALSPALTAHLDTLESVTMRLRELEALGPVERHFPTRAEVVDFIRRSFEAELTDEILRRETQFYFGFELLPSDIDLLEVYLNFLSSPSGVAGYYDTDTRQMNVLPMGGGARGDRLPLLEQVIYVHEYTHALQDQHFGLDGLLDDETLLNDPDRAIAVQSLVEGDATAVMTTYLQQAAQRNPLAALGMLAQSFQAGAFNIPAGTPDFIVTELTFPYQEGAIFVQALLDDGGWEAVNRAYTALPVSSEQILHPEKYLAGEKPLPVSIQSQPPDAGWERLIDRRLGEFYLRAFLQTQLTARTARTAAAGWGGDRFHLYYQPEADQRAWALKLAWDTSQDAAEFVEAIRQFAAARFAEGESDGECWWADSAALCLLDTGATPLVVYAPTPELARALEAR